MQKGFTHYRKNYIRSHISQNQINLSKKKNYETYNIKKWKMNLEGTPNSIVNQECKRAAIDAGFYHCVSKQSYQTCIN